eukprot:CAMPEP_0180206946 /NCGR_PEP_ID=MMETSP0987-20121128/9837_1 /TAXON_ID=697907 /ORGANISM="non described non described, Strain CCMP2293" /LENGTH=217 /DNA_ID=CAMNT_0022162779 /DNA_START=480 /DNA_END=1130 /DNA_ORIENTATION=+
MMIGCSSQTSSDSCTRISLTIPSARTRASTEALHVSMRATIWSSCTLCPTSTHISHISPSSAATVMPPGPETSGAITHHSSAANVGSGPLYTAMNRLGAVFPRSLSGCDMAGRLDQIPAKIPAREISGACTSGRATGSSAGVRGASGSRGAWYSRAADDRERIRIRDAILRGSPSNSRAVKLRWNALYLATRPQCKHYPEAASREHVKQGAKPSEQG